MKAFLSHSSNDKEFVRQISNKLGRQNCIFDEQCFETGVDFKKSIEKYLDRSSIFVLFATSSSMKSVWVNFEIDEVWYEVLSGKIATSLVYIIDNECNYDEIPNWLNRALIKKETSPSIIANDIQHFIDQQAYEQQTSNFVGRSRDQEKLEDLVNPIDGTPPPRSIAINGLPGVGRRTLIKRSSSQLFNIDKQAEIRIESGDTINDLCSKLADLAEPYSNQQELKDKVDEIAKLSNQSAGERALRNLRYLVDSGVLPIIIDEGGLLDVNGFLREPIVEILKKMDSNETTYISFITNRKINRDSPVEIPYIIINPLSERDTKKLVSKIANNFLLPLDTKEVNEISEYVHGYPPAAYFAIKQCIEYGKDLLLSDKHRLVKFSSQRFMTHLKSSYLTEVQENILSILSTYSPLPLIAIATYCAWEQKKLHESIYDLIDKALVIVDSNALYRIADPISNAARNLFGFPENKRLKDVILVLKEYSDNIDNRKKLEVSRVLFRIGAILKDKTLQNEGIHLRNDFIKLVQISYHNRNYKDAIEFGEKALEECPDNNDAREFLVRALIQDERWAAAEFQLEEYKKHTELRDVYFLAGFLARKRGNISDAVEKFKDAEKVGRRGAAIKRELAHSYMLMNNIDDAVKYITEALSFQDDNKHVVDLAVKIYLKAEMEEETKNALARLELLDNSEYFSLRKSTVEYKFGNIFEAETAAKKAISQGGKNFFSAKVQLIKCYIKGGKLTDAQKNLNDLDITFKGKKNDVRTSLRCNLLIAQSKFKDSLQCAEQFMDKSCFQCNAIKFKALRALSENISIPYEDRKQYKNVLGELEGIPNVTM